jgi:GNAT superfamily N-acetyltransferase
MAIELRPVVDTAGLDYLFAERTLTQLFPREEYRDLTVWRDYVARRTDFRLLVARERERPVGLLSYWDFGWFRYVEHLGVAAAEQGEGYGSRMLRAFQEASPLPIVLEVELPEDETTRRRVAFYERQGFRLWAHPYAQPPYRPGDAPVPMRLMAYGPVDESRAAEVQRRIYLEVYGVS